MTSSAPDIRAIIVGTGGYLPAEVLDNEALAKRYSLDTSDEWIVERTGIRQRHLAAPGETAGDMGAAAARAALAQAGVDVSEVDAIIVATATPDSAFPSTAARVQAKLGVKKGFAFDISAACTGFVYALSVANSMVCTGQARCALVIGSGTAPARCCCGRPRQRRPKGAACCPATCMPTAPRVTS
jgi:3-oxoacyl-[acyl-carrier-protein] synthase-3